MFTALGAIYFLACAHRVAPNGHRSGPNSNL